MEQVMYPSFQTSLLSLPDELLHNVFCFLPPQQTTRLGLTCTRLYQISKSSSLWSHYYEEHFMFWPVQSNFPTKFTSLGDSKWLTPTNPAGWRTMYIEHVKKDKESEILFEEIVNGGHNRFIKMNHIADRKFNAWPIIDRQFNVDDKAPDVLARKYWSSQTLHLIHQKLAVSTLSSLLNRDNPNLSLEDTFIAIDFLTLGASQAGLPQYYRSAFVDIAHEILSQNQGFMDYSISQKMSAIISHLQPRLKIPEDVPYRNLIHSFISFTLMNKGTGNLPLQSAVIVCCLARRFQIRASPTNTPTHVLICVDPSPDGTADISEYLLFDPWEPNEMSHAMYAERFSRLIHMTGQSIEDSIRPAMVEKLIERTVKNLLSSYSEWERKIIPWKQVIHPFTALYAVQWIECLFLSTSENHSVERNDLASVFDRGTFGDDMKRDFPQDYITLGNVLKDSMKFPNIMACWREIKEQDEEIDRVRGHRRGQGSRVKYKIGQVLRHVRYGYKGVIVAWHDKCSQGESWIRRMGVDDLEGGADQPFYDVFAEDLTPRHVAQENITIVQDTQPLAINQITLGRYFKRFDSEKGVYISNITDEFPDD